MSDKYIIRNCPAFNDTPNMYNEVYGYCDNEHDIDLNKCMCENINDCVMKQIVKKCSKSLEVSYCPIEKEILELLDIEEVE